jgi:pimeloyl-ACP methyl ester carboxylesterase
MRCSELVRPTSLIVAGLALAGGALALANRALLLDDLPPTLPGSMHDWTWRGWRIRYTTMGSGSPIVLVHGLHAAASSFEMRNIFEPLSQRHAVYAVDLLGFGKSERPRASFSGPFFRDLLADFLDDVIGGPTVVVASSLSSGYAVDVARRRPGLITGLVLFSPTGTADTGPFGRAAGSILALPLVGSAAFNLLVSRASIRRYLEKVSADPALVDDPMVEQAWATSHQPNARLAPAAFVAGRLNLPLVDDQTPVSAPILVIRGSVPGLGEAAADAALQQLGPNVTIRTFEGVGQLPHDAAPDETVEAIEGWLTVDH